MYGGTNKMENLFNDVATEEVAVAEKTEVKASNQKTAELKEEFKKTLSSDPSFKEVHKTLSASLEVVNTLGFGDSGNIYVDKSKSTDDQRALAPTSKIVGYAVKNIGKEPIPYTTEVYAADAEGKFVGKTVEKVLAPGATAHLTRQFMTVLCAQPAVSFQLANGSVVRGSGATRPGAPIKEELEAYYFLFAKDEATGVRKQVNDDSVKLNVGKKVGDKWQVKADFVETFGFLNNPKESKKGKRAAGEASKYNTADLAANWAFTLKH